MAILLSPPTLGLKPKEEEQRSRTSKNEQRHEATREGIDPKGTTQKKLKDGEHFYFCPQPHIHKSNTQKSTRARASIPSVSLTHTLSLPRSPFSFFSFSASLPFGHTCTYHCMA